MATGVRIAAAKRMDAGGAGLDVALVAALPWFLPLNASASVGLMQAIVSDGDAAEISALHTRNFM